MNIKKIMLLDTSIATLNTGDAIINSSIRMNWKELFNNNYYCLYPAHTPPFSWWQQLFFKNKLASFKDFDYKFLCGTNGLYTNMLRPLPGWNIHLLNADFYKDTILLGVGAGINSDSINLYTKAIYNKVLSKDYIHSVRDDYSVEMLEKIGYKAINTSCPTMWGLTPEHCLEIPTVKSRNVVFTLTSYQPDRINDKIMVDILRKNYETLYFWPQTISDLDYLISLGTTDFQVVAPNLESYDNVLERDVDYVGNRLHGGIRALQHKKRATIISIDYRAENMAKKFSLPVIERKCIQDRLTDIIENAEPIMVRGIDFEKINKWKSQFDIV